MNESVSATLEIIVGVTLLGILILWVIVSCIRESFHKVHHHRHGHDHSINNHDHVTITITEYDAARILEYRQTYLGESESPTLVEDFNDTIEESSILAAKFNDTIVEAIPVVQFKSQDFKEGVECVVCLEELADGDKAKVLPRCDHCFHAGCIDSWFRSRHSTCPICRESVVGLTQQLGEKPELNHGDDADESLNQNLEITNSSEHS